MRTGKRCDQQRCFSDADQNYYYFVERKKMRCFVMRNMLGIILAGLAVVALPAIADEVRLKPFVLGTAPAGNMEQAVAAVKAALKAQGFDEAGSYSPYAGATVIVVTSPEIKAAAVAKAKLGGFGAGQRVAVTDYKGKLQVSYMNPAYLGAAYGLGKLEAVSEKLKTALGATREFGAVDGLTAEALAPGTYHYMVGMPYFQQVDVHAKYPNYQAALAAVEKGLAAGKGGTKKVYRIDLPGREASVFGVAIVTGDGIDKGDKDTDKEIMDILDWQELRITAALPNEILVQGGEVMSLRGRYRIALHSPDTKMAGAHGFTKIMSAPGGIKAALNAVAGGE
jgi:hypothetical protein